MASRQHHQRGLVAIDRRGELRVELLPAGELLVIEHLGGDALLARKLQPAGVGAVADHGGNFGVEALAPEDRSAWGYSRASSGEELLGRYRELLGVVR